MSHHSKLVRLAAAHDAQLGRRPRRLLQEFPRAFEGLTPRQSLWIARRALSLAGDIWAIKEQHVLQARYEHDLRR